MECSFFERMEREIDIQKEYEKIDNLILNKEDYHSGTLQERISKSFYAWKHRKNFTSFDELREYLGFGYSNEGFFDQLIPTGVLTGIDDFLCYCEAIYNMIALITVNFSFVSLELEKLVIDTIRYDTERLGYEFIKDEDRYILVQKNAAASSVAELVNYDLAKEILRYNHYALKGDINSKRSILYKIAFELENMRKDLKECGYKNIESDFFFMVNNMDVRHNNSGKNDANNHNAKFTALSNEEKEKWYDEIYQEGLMAFLLLEQKKRDKRIYDFKNS